MSIVVHLDNERKTFFDVIVLVEPAMQPEAHLRRPFDTDQLHVGKIARNRGRLLVASLAYEFGEFKVSFYP
jgi:hypothetical protein